MTDTIIEEYRDWTIVYHSEHEEFHAIKGKRRLKPTVGDRYGNTDVKHAKERVDGDILAKKRKATRDGKPELEYRHWENDLEVTSTLVNYTNRGWKTTEQLLEVSFGNRNLLIIPKAFDLTRLHRAVDGLRVAVAEHDAALRDATTNIEITNARGGTPERYAEIEDQIREDIDAAS